MTKSLLSTTVLLLCFGYTVAQQHRISVTPEYNIPLGKMGWSYKASPGVQLNFSFVNNDHSKMLVCSGITVGYTSMSPVADTLYYPVDDGGVDGASLGTAVYSSFKMLQVKGSFDLSFSLNKKMSFQIGTGIGLIYGSRTMAFNDTSTDDEISETVGWVNLSPNMGLEFILNDHISLVPTVTYTAMIQAGSTDSQSMNYNPDTGSFYHFYSPSLSLNFYF